MTALPFILVIFVQFKSETSGFPLHSGWRITEHVYLLLTFYVNIDEHYCPRQLQFLIIHLYDIFIV